MPLIRTGTDRFPEWSEIDDIQIVSFEGIKNFRILSPLFAVFAARGECNISSADQKVTIGTGGSFYFRKSSEEVTAASSSCKLVFIQGRWGEHTGHSGFFSLENSRTPRNTGDPVAYTRSTDFDNHFHDFDEVWVILEGSGLAVSEDITYKFSAGDCILTKAGDHHDLPEVYEKISGLYFETTLKGEQRLGHLWDHTHSNKIGKNL